MVEGGRLSVCWGDPLHSLSPSTSGELLGDQAFLMSGVADGARSLLMSVTIVLDVGVLHSAGTGGTTTYGCSLFGVGADFNEGMVVGFAWPCSGLFEWTRFTLGD